MTFRSFLSPVFAAALVASIGCVLLAGCSGPGASTEGRAASRGYTDSPALGTWEYRLEGMSHAQMGGRFTVKAAGDSLAGDIFADFLLQTVPLDEVHISGDSLTFSAVFTPRGERVPVSATLVVDGRAMQGSFLMPGLGYQRIVAFRSRR